MARFQIDRWRRLTAQLRAWADEGTVPAVSCCTLNLQGELHRASFGSLAVDRRVPLPESPLYLVASITKPLVATAALILVERGLLSLTDRVVDIIPEFAGQGRYGVDVRHLLTHTSGLPDQLPNNQELRQARAPREAFLQGVYQVPLTFPPGSGSAYQSMGFLLLDEIIARVSGKSCAVFVRDELLRPLRMPESFLGLPEDSPLQDRIPEIRVPLNQAGGSQWNWNSWYWRSFGAAWGGFLSTDRDLANFARFWMRGGVTEAGDCLLTPMTILLARTNQLQHYPQLAEADRRSRPWGFGWRLNWPTHTSSFGDLLGERTYGHWGATGTLMWIDPDREIATVILSTAAYDQSRSVLLRLSNLASACWQ